MTRIERRIEDRKIRHRKPVFLLPRLDTVLHLRGLQRGHQAIAHL